MNDDEWPETMAPFVEKLEEYDTARIPDDSVLRFLKDWKSPINEENQEELTKPGARDAEAYGKRIRELYPDLIPKKNDPPFKYVLPASAAILPSADNYTQNLHREFTS